MVVLSTLVDGVAHITQGCYQWNGNQQLEVGRGEGPVFGDRQTDRHAGREGRGPSLWTDRQTDMQVGRGKGPVFGQTDRQTDMQVGRGEGPVFGDRQLK